MSTGGSGGEQNIAGWQWSRKSSGGTIQQAFVRADVGNTEINEN